MREDFKNKVIKDLQTGKKKKKKDDQLETNLSKQALQTIDR